MPNETDVFMLNRKISQQEFELLEYGRIPKEMEDKWFIYYDSGKLYFHRSWSGFCVYIADVDKVGANFNVGRIIVNRNKEQYKESDVDADKNKVCILINGLLGESNRENFEKYKQHLHSQ